MKVGLFIPCYIDAIAPKAAISTYHLLKKLGMEVEYIDRGACCGLPAFDMGYRKSACSIEKGIAPYISGTDCEYIVVPSGICTDQFRAYFIDVEQTEDVRHMRSIVYDPVEFLHDVLKIEELPWHPEFYHRVALHHGCHSLRYLHMARPTELMVNPYDKCADLLRLVDGIEIGYATRRDECCGFGGTYAIWDQSCSGQQGRDKVNDYARNDFHYVVSEDMSCLLHQSGVARKLGLDIKMYYITEILNGDAI
ncbi:MAG: (Fe-S)-binding protein [Candidatus Amulumruptor caecigallinarius]|nr:(Fe-S)-binding protein [Candidatus Amulumruptor caecigallinarius]